MTKMRHTVRPSASDLSLSLSRYSFHMFCYVNEILCTLHALNALFKTSFLRGPSIYIGVHGGNGVCLCVKISFILFGFQCALSVLTHCALKFNIQSTKNGCFQCMNKWEHTVCLSAPSANEIRMRIYIITYISNFIYLFIAHMWIWDRIRRHVK